MRYQFWNMTQTVWLLPERAVMLFMEKEIDEYNMDAVTEVE